MYVAKEESDCIFRQLLNPCREYEYEVRLPTDVNDDKEPGGESVMGLHKKFAWTLFTFNRPVVKIFDGSVEGNNKIGFVKLPYNLVDCIADTEDSSGEKVLHMRLDPPWTQQIPAICCPLPLEACEKLHFVVEDPSGNEVARYYRHVPGWLKGCLCPHVADYKIDYKTQLDGEKKALAMASIIAMDNLYFTTLMYRYYL